ncbi:MAG: grasp-with-spasm system SPASM domain peptide maturase [Porphyromonadaceae bacterium]|nr:grasp-with-spasm system SPASM domain peptide maturase [Porphyromonadaceae bacterium]
MIHFSIYNCCFITKGFSRGCLIDVERNLHCSVPLELCNILDNKQISEKSDFFEHIEFLRNEGFLYFTDPNEVDSYSHNEIFTPFVFNNLIFDVSNIDDFFSRIQKINSNEIETIQIRFYFKLNIQQIYSVLCYLVERDFYSIELLFNHDENNSTEEYLKIYNSYEYITKLVVFNYMSDIYPKIKNIFFVQQELESENQCGKISENLFCPNLRTFLSAKTANSCLYKKISIDKKGYIKNCPSMNKSYGNIDDNITLKEALSIPDFTKLWHITKDQIEVCKDCEFRYICTDCRCFITDKNNILSKPKNCKYNPYSTEWEE